VNSSPPWRQTMSSARVISLSKAPTWMRAVSPAPWPN
jgi:hypothetical protein